ncbi:rCG20209 [Rattus norvegicus]|uniref:RCG20209 n=1 Tax=Rattus norvegicus TaxID=10116 RepID=A6JGH5_RAT|nr:rCG20209 [Rattus norvegicus]
MKTVYLLLHIGWQRALGSSPAIQLQSQDWISQGGDSHETCKLPSDLHIQALACACTHAPAHERKHLKTFLSSSNLYLLFCVWVFCFLFLCGFLLISTDKSFCK